MYKVFLAFPDALRPAFPRLKEKLEDPDPGTIVVIIIGCLILLHFSSFFLFKVCNRQQLMLSANWREKTPKTI